MLSTKRIDFLKNQAKKIRKDIIEMSLRAKSAHTGGALSCVEILVSLYFEIMNINPQNPYGKERDRLVFSKAHDAKALYAVLAERGFFDKKFLEGYESNNGKLPGHSTRHCVSGVEVSAGSLGHGLSMAMGMAYAGKIDSKKHRIFCIISDGECDEGSTWEAILFAGHHKLDNLVAIVDYNKLQGFGHTKDVLNLEPFSKKWGSFGWEVVEVDGHNFNELITAFKKISIKKNKPTVIIAHTIKGLGGVPIYVNKISSQYKSPTQEEADEAIRRLSLK
ncbi:MAG: transketolase [Candidatus Levybacteria bacterium]|nr:transketolase [Candidatus Levybacteria bacterium]